MHNKILVVDDDFLSREILLNVLLETGCLIEEAVDGAEALHKIQESSDEFQVVITDYRMPKMDGIKLIAAVNNLKLEKKPVFILLTGNYSGIENKTCRSLNIFSTLPKPFDDDALIGTVKAAIEEYTKPYSLV